jgi:fimbrial isopeptide formation D2 family protein
MLSLKKKGLVASVATLAMAIGGLGIGAGVANAAGAETLTLNNPIKDDTYTVYQIGEYAGCSTDSVAVTATEGASKVVKDAIDADSTIKAAPKGTTDYVSYAATLPSYGSDIRKIAAGLTNDKLAAAGVPTVADASDKVKAGSLDGLDAGWYAITDQYKDAKGNLVDGVTTVVGTACGDLSGTGEADLKPHDGNPDNGNGDIDPTKSLNGAVMKGATDVFTLAANLPDYSKYDSSTLEFKFTDHPSSALDVDQTSLKVFVDGSATPLDASEYTVDWDGATNPAGGKDFTIDLSAYLKANAGKKSVKVTYSATVNGTLKDEDVAQINSFDVDNNGVPVPSTPHDPNPGNPGEDTPIDTTKDIEFTKTDIADKALKGAVFTLVGADGSTVDSVATGEDGVVKFENLGAGTYTIQEKTAPTKADTQTSGADTADYALPSADSEVLQAVVKITPGTAAVEDDPATTDVDETKAEVPATGTVDLSVKNNSWDLIDATDTSAIKFHNTSSLTQLPLTGAAGVILFGVIAVLLAGGSFAMVQVSKRNKKTGLAL